MAFIKFIIENTEGIPFDDELRDADASACVAAGLARKGHVVFSTPVSIGCDADCEGCTIFTDDAAEGCHHATFFESTIDAVYDTMREC